MEMILRVYSEFFTNLIKACHFVEVSVRYAVFIVAVTWILDE
jgi:hypothetical protein